jgi:hypothetical protein
VIYSGPSIKEWKPMPETMELVGLTDLDRLSLQDEFEHAGHEKALTFDEKNAKLGTAGALDPITATVIMTAMAAKLLAIWICKRRTRTVVYKDGKEVEIKVTDTAECQPNVIAQLAKLFPKIDV